MSLREDRRPVRPWMLTWTPEHVERFWNWMAPRSISDQLYFSALVGDAILDQVKRRISLRGTVVDFGCGPGHLIERLTARGISTIGVDSSEGSVDAVQKKCSGNRYFLGVHVTKGNRSSIADGVADVLFLVETVEHLTDEGLPAVLSETRRLLRTGGHIVITTPNTEELARSHTMCPDCGCVYHVMQHVRTWSKDTLVQTLSREGFDVVFCSPTLFSPYPKALRIAHKWKFSILGSILPHLLYIGRRR